MRVPVDRATDEALLADLRARLAGFIARRIADPHAAEDVAQEVIVRIHRGIGTLRDDERLDAWAYQVARNAIADHHRAAATAREVAAADDVAEAPSPEPGEDEGDARGEIARCLAPMVARLAPDYREALELTDLGSLTQAAAAERVGLSVPGMKTRVQRARAQVREQLLACCEVATDARSRVVGFDRRDGGRCGCIDNCR